MKKIQYILTTPIKQQRADFIEWRALRYKCASLRLDKFCTYDSLIRWIGKSQNPDDIRACVKRHEYRTDLSNAPYDSFCKNFNPNNIYGACNEEFCPFHQRNNEFFSVLKRYESAINSRRNFWNNKINQH